MLGKLHIQQDWVTVLAFLCGAAVMLPSMVTLVLSLGAVAKLLF